MPKIEEYDAVVVGSGPNGLAAAITLAQAGLNVVVFEGKSTIGGGMRTAELTLPGFSHDICSAIHPLGLASPFFRNLQLNKYGLEWVQPLAPLAHPFDDGTAAMVERSIDATCLTLDLDAVPYKTLMEPFAARWEDLVPDLLSPLHFPFHPIEMARFSFYAIRSAQNLINKYFKGEHASGLFAGLSAHSIMPLDKPLTAAFGLILGILGHSVGWPMARSGSQKIADALAAYFNSLGGQIFTGENIKNIDQLPASRVILCDVTPRQLLQMAGQYLPASYKNKLESYRYGPGVFKMDWALNQPIPWKVKECMRAGTIHLGGTAAEISASEKLVSENQHPKKPFIIMAQQSLFDKTRAPKGKHTAWGYCHVPNDSIVDMSKNIEDQVERFAPGFKDCIIGRSTKSAMQLEQYNPNYIGGDINGGVQDLFQLFTRPTTRWVPYSTPVRGLYICSSSTPPGGGVHGMCGYHAAKAALKACF